MKNFKALTLTLISFFILSVAMANSKKTDTQFMFKPGTELNSGIANQITYPAEAKSNFVEGTVATSITILNNGSIQVNEINGHPMLIKSVKQQLEKTVVGTDFINPSREMLLKFNFEIQ